MNIDFNIATNILIIQFYLNLPIKPLLIFLIKFDAKTYFYLSPLSEQKEKSYT